MDLDYLRELGYSNHEIEEYSTHWNDVIIQDLSNNSSSVQENMKYLWNDFDKDFILRLSVFYPDTFCLSPELFRERIEIFKKAFPIDWSDIIENQLYGYDGICGTNYKPILKTLGSYSNEDVEKAIAQLKNPSTIVFEFIVLLKEIGIESSADDYYWDFLWDIEASKYTFVNNAKHLLSQGLPKEIVEELLFSAPSIMMLSEAEIEKKLETGFGSEYINDMQQLDRDTFSKKLQDIAW